MSRARHPYTLMARLIAYCIARLRDDRLRRDMRRLKRQHAVEIRKLTDSHRAQLRQLSDQCESLRRLGSNDNEVIGGLTRENQDLKQRLQLLEEHVQLLERHRDATLDLLDRIAWTARSDAARCKQQVESVGVAGSVIRDDTGH